MNWASMRPENLMFGSVLMPVVEPSAVSGGIVVASNPCWITWLAHQLLSDWLALHEAFA